MSTVVYKPVPDFPGYRVGDDGSVWSCFVPRTRRISDPVVWKQLKPGPRGNYTCVQLYNDERKWVVNVGVLVLLVFVGPRPHPKSQCRHFPDNDINNNALSNLSWGTVQQNHDDKQTHGTTARGERHGRSKLTADKVRRIKEMRRQGKTVKHIANFFSVGETTVGHILNGDNWKHVD